MVTYIVNILGEYKSLNVETHGKSPIVYNELMTASLDPSMLLEQTVSITGLGTRGDIPHGTPPQEAWANVGQHRPNTLFDNGSNNECNIPHSNQQSSREQLRQSTVTDGSSSEVATNKQIKDIYLQDLSDSK